MPHSEHACYEVKINRFLHIQTKQNLIWLAALTLIAVLYIVSFLINRSVDFPNPLGVISGCVIVMGAKLFCGPKCLDVTPETVKFSYWGASVRFWRLSPRSIRIFFNGEPAREKSHTLYNIKSIKYLQTPLEKIFSCGE